MNTKVVVFDKNNISIDETGHITYNCTKEFAKDLKKYYGVNVQDQDILRHVYFGTVGGKVSFTIPNKIMKS